jgi:hypothetical protein
MRFQDSWIQGGVIGAVGYLSIFLIGICQGVRRAIQERASDDVACLYGLALVLAAAVLAMREYAFVCLWVQSAGGLLLAIGLVLTLPKSDNVKTKLRY